MRTTLSVFLAMGSAVFMAGRSAGQEGDFRDRLRFFPDSEAQRKPGEVDVSRPIPIKNLSRWKTKTLPAERVYLGRYYKPCVARLPNGQLRLSARATSPHYDFTKNDFPIRQSSDGGRTWSKLAEPPFLPSENYMTVLGKGTVLMTFAGSWRGQGSSDRSCAIYRSEDGCATWQHSGLPGSSVGSRNVLELPDGSLLWGQSVSDSRAKDKDMVWRSFDGGRTWPGKYPARFDGMPDDYPYGMFCEMFVWQGSSGRLFGIARVDFRHMPPIPGKEKPSREWIDRVIDQSEGMLLYASDDLGKTWKPLRYLGDYGQHYPSILRLQDGRLLLTYTVRDPVPHETGLVGTSAVVGAEQDNDLRFDFDHDVLLIEARRPYCRQPFTKGKPWIWNPRGAAGWSPTVQLDDGTLLTACSYRTGTSDDADRSEGEPLHSEVVRWRVPDKE
jgi:hypothetical protein